MTMVMMMMMMMALALVGPGPLSLTTVHWTAHGRGEQAVVPTHLGQRQGLQRFVDSTPGAWASLATGTL
eukprot:9048950-Karenia_brevis.AAC.1